MNANVGKTYRLYNQDNQPTCLAWVVLSKSYLNTRILNVHTKAAERIPTAEFLQYLKEGSLREES